jgi:hypothetical protein
MPKTTQQCFFVRRAKMVLMLSFDAFFQCQVSHASFVKACLENVGEEDASHVKSPIASTSTPAAEGSSFWNAIFDLFEVWT